MDGEKVDEKWKQGGAATKRWVSFVRKKVVAGPFSLFLSIGCVHFAL